ncbi:putative target of rapamycin (TOR) kinase 1 [Trypanosoma cruzi]|nr:putative target of rapamycin (TOR) kinase 1 [Trypanosoma cruzi]
MVALPFHSILAHYGTKPPLYWTWLRLFTGGSFGGYARTSFRCRVRFVDLVKLTRPHTGHECCPEVPRTTARVLAEDPEIVRPQSVVPRVVRAPVWISSIRTSGRRKSVVRRGQCAAKKWRQQENRRSLPRGVNLLAYRSAARRRVSP